MAVVKLTGVLPRNHTHRRNWVLEYLNNNRPLFASHQSKRSDTVRSVAMIMMRLQSVRQCHPPGLPAKVLELSKFFSLERSAA
jgi:hypothetical protein